MDQYLNGNPTLKGLEDAPDKDGLIEYGLVSNRLLLNVRNEEECANDRERWKQYVVAAMGLKGL